jgi:hypothetical protein
MALRQTMSGYRVPLRLHAEICTAGFFFIIDSWIPAFARMRGKGARTLAYRVGPYSKTKSKRVSCPSVKTNSFTARKGEEPVGQSRDACGASEDCS